MKAMDCFKLFMIVALLGSAASANPYMGEYKGTYHPDGAVTMAATAKVVAEGDDVHFRIVITAKPNGPDQDGADVELYGHRQGTLITIGDNAGGYNWNGQINNGHLSVSSGYGQHFELDKFVRKNPNDGLKAPKGAIVLLAQTKDEPDLTAWTNQQWKKLPGGIMQVEKGGSKTKQSFGDIEHLHLEFKMPLEPNNRGQGRGNSGMFLAGLYEVQILDSFGMTHTSGDCAGLYGVARTLVQASLPPEQWQSYDVKFQAAKLNPDGTVKANARVTVHHNGILVHDDVEIPHPTADPKAQVKDSGPIELQDHSHKVQFRNIWIVEAK